MRRSYALLLIFWLFALLPAPVLADMPLFPQTLHGTWMGTNGQDTMTLVFTDQYCTLALNNQQMPGLWNLNGNRLNIQFQNGKQLSYSVALFGNDLILDGNIRLTRQNMPQAATSPLEGYWYVQTLQGIRAFQFSGAHYAQIVAGQVLEEGMFSLAPDGSFTYQVTAGQYAGQRGQNRVALSANTMTMYWPDGTHLTYTRSAFGETQATSPQQTQGPATPLEGRWIWARSGMNSFGFVFSGNRFTCSYNGAEIASGTFTMS